MDITKSTEPKSDQQNYDDYIGGPKTVTVSEVKAGSAEHRRCSRRSGGAS